MISISLGLGLSGFAGPEHARPVSSSPKAVGVLAPLSAEEGVEIAAVDASAAFGGRGLVFTAENLAAGLAIDPATGRPPDDASTA